MKTNELNQEIDQELAELERSGLIEVDRSDPLNPRYRLTESGRIAIGSSR